MSDDAIDVFFYGLFMDPEALRLKGMKPRLPRKASVAGMALRLGNRATLVRQEGGVAHGLVMTLTKRELEELYAEASVAAYRPEPVTAACEDGTRLTAACYNLPSPELAPANTDYAAKLRAVAERMGLPSGYIQSIG